MSYMEFLLNEHRNLFTCVICSSISMNMGTCLNLLFGVLSQEHRNLFKCVVWGSISMNMGTYLDVLYGVLSQ